MRTQVFTDHSSVRLILMAFGLFVFSGIASSQGLPLVEDFSDEVLMDAAGTTANWSAEEQALFLAWRDSGLGYRENYLAGTDISGDSNATFDIAVGDVDGDGYLDVVVANNNQVNRLYLNNGTADPFNGVTGTDITADSDATIGIALGDLDGDGDLDVVAGNIAGIGGDKDRIYLNNGTADPFDGVTGIDLSADTTQTYSIALGDMDGDGDLDVVTGNNNQTNRLYLNDGSGSFAAGTDISADVNYTYGVALGDMDGDGDLDVVAGNQISQTNRLYLNNGTAAPFDGVTGKNISGDAGTTECIALADLNGDGHLDVVAGSGSAAVNRFYLNNGTADPFNGVSGTNLSADEAFTGGIAVGDADGDGDLDVVAGRDGRVNRLYLNNGTGAPFSGVTGIDVTAHEGNTNALVLRDMDGDGHLDIVEGTNAQSNRLYLNNGGGSPFHGVTGSNITAETGFTEDVLIRDMDGDGDLDLVEGNNTQPNRLFLNNGTADPFDGVTGSDISTDANATFAMAVGDVDGDGDLDVVAANNNQVNRLYLNNGTADPFNGVTGLDITADSDATIGIALGDVDGDGDLDVVAGNIAGIPGDKDRVYLNNGTADPFDGVTGIDLSADTTQTYSIALGDVDGDGDLDVVTGNNNQTNRLYLNDGSGSFGAGTDVSADVNFTYAVALGDMDRDGDLDVVAGNEISQINRLYLNNGTAAPFDGVTGKNISGDAGNTESIALADLNGDGHLDVVAGSGSAAANRFYLNNGTADPFNGVSGTNLSADEGFSPGIATGDMDGDGILDVVAGRDGRVNRLYLNGGSAPHFVVVSGSDISTDTATTLSVAVGDLDRDGDTDLVAGNGTANRLYLNNGDTEPFFAVTGANISADSSTTFSIALGDLDHDGYLDVVAGNLGANRLYLNNGTAAPFNGVVGSNITGDSSETRSIALGDIDGDGDLDVAAATFAQANRLYLNNGTANPFNGVTGSDITSDSSSTTSIALGDIDADGDIDLIAGNSAQANRLYLNNGTSDPFNGVTGSDITADTHDTSDIAVGDVDGDGHLDLVVGNDGGVNRLYLNNGTTDPFNGVTGSDISSDTNATQSIALHDVDRDGDLDVVTGNEGERGRVYLNNGTSDPFNGVSGIDVTTDTGLTSSIALHDVNGDGDPDVIAGNDGVNRLYLNRGYDTGDGLATSLKVNDTEANIARVTLSATDETNTSSTRNTAIAYYLSNDGGAQWHRVTPGTAFDFPAFGDDLRWKADLASLSPVVTPQIDTIGIEENLVPYDDTTATDLRNDFGTLDTSGDGTLSLSESGFATLAELKAYDANGDGQITMSDLLESTVGPVGVATPVYVDFAYAGTEAGSQAQPFNSLLEAAVFVADGGTVSIASGSSGETLIIDKQLSLVAGGGTVTIGTP